MNQFKNILHFELKYYLKNKVFVGVTVFLILLIAVVMFFPRISAVIQFDKQSDTAQDRPVMLVKLEEEEQEQEQTIQEAFSPVMMYSVPTRIHRPLRSRLPQGMQNALLFSHHPHPVPIIRSPCLCTIPIQQ